VSGNYACVVDGGIMAVDKPVLGQLGGRWMG
jgi:hypothetical protein